MTASGTPSRYAAFGLVVESAISLPELPPAPHGVDADVTIELGSVPVDEVREGGPQLRFDDPREFTLVYPMCRVLVCDGERLVVDPVDGWADRDVRWVVLGPGLNFLLHQRGHLVLHGSTVGVTLGDREVAIAFVGASGAGKSTTAAAFVDAGHRALGDDIAAVRVTDSGPVVRPGFPSLKLDGPAAARLAGGLEPVADGGATTEHTERFYRAVAGDDDELPLAAVFRVVDGDELRFVDLPSTTATIELVRNAYTVGTQRRHGEASLALDRSVAVASAVPVTRLERPRRFDVLDEVVRAVEERLTDQLVGGTRP